MSNAAELCICMDRLESPIDSLPLSYQDPLTKDPLYELITSHKEAGKCFILARVETRIPTQDGSKSKYFYYHAHALNKLLFRQHGDEHLFRLMLMNPLTNTEIIGVEYYAVDPQKYKREFTENNSCNSNSNSETKEWDSTGASCISHSCSEIESQSGIDSLPSFNVSSSMQSNSVGVCYYSFDYLQNPHQKESVKIVKMKSDPLILSHNKHKSINPSKHMYFESSESLFASNNASVASLSQFSSKSDLTDKSHDVQEEESFSSTVYIENLNMDATTQSYNTSVKSLKFNSVITTISPMDSSAIPSITKPSEIIASKRSSIKFPSITPSALAATIDDWKSKMSSYSQVADENRSILSRLRVASNYSKHNDSNMLGLTASQYSIVGV